MGSQALTTLGDEASVAAFKMQQQQVAMSALVPSYARPRRLGVSDHPYIEQNLRVPAKLVAVDLIWRLERPLSRA